MLKIYFFERFVLSSVCLGDTKSTKLHQRAQNCTVVFYVSETKGSHQTVFSLFKNSPGKRHKESKKDYPSERSLISTSPPSYLSLTLSARARFCCLLLSVDKRSDTRLVYNNTREHVCILAEDDVFLCLHRDE